MKLPILAERAFDFSSLGASDQVDVVLVKSLDVTDYRSGELQVRVHAASWSSASPQDVFVKAYMTAPCPDDPSTDFVGTTAMATATLSDSGGNTSAGDMLNAGLTAGFGSYLRIELDITQSGASEPLSFTISADMVLNEDP